MEVVPSALPDRAGLQRAVVLRRRAGSAAGVGAEIGARDPVGDGEDRDLQCQSLAQKSGFMRNRPRQSPGSGQPVGVGHGGPASACSLIADRAASPPESPVLVLRPRGAGAVTTCCNIYARVNNPTENL